MKPEITLPTDARKRAIASIKRYVAERMDQDVGDLKAGLLLDYFLQELGPTVYNQAITDARAFFQERVADLEGACYRMEFSYWPGPSRPT